MAQGHECVTVNVTGRGFDPHSMKYLLKFISSFLRSRVKKHAMPPEFGGKWETECLTVHRVLFALLCAGYSVKLIKFNLCQ